MLKYVKAFTRDKLDLALVNSNTLVTTSYILKLLYTKYKIYTLYLTDYNLD